MIFFRKKVTKEELIAAKQAAIDAGEEYRKSEIEYYNTPDSAGAQKIVDLNINQKILRKKFISLDSHYDKLWNRYRKENHL